jgi:hypothetical protein
MSTWSIQNLGCIFKIRKLSRISLTIKFFRLKWREYFTKEWKRKTIEWRWRIWFSNENEQNLIVSQINYQIQYLDKDVTLKRKIYRIIKMNYISWFSNSKLI